MDRTCWTIQTHSEDLHSARRRTFHELNSLRALSIEPKSLVWISATSSSEWSSVFQNVQKEDNLARYTQIFGNFYRKFSFHSTLLPEFLEFTVEWFAFLKFNSFFVPFAAISNFSKVLVDWWKRPKWKVWRLAKALEVKLGCSAAMKS